jgi:hypothetical protein
MAGVICRLGDKSTKSRAIWHKPNKHALPNFKLLRGDGFIGGF